LDAREKIGRNNRPSRLIIGFCPAVLGSGLSDVPIEGYPFTWFKSLGTPRAVEERLDRALANNLWFSLFPEASVETLVAPASDHYLILINHLPMPRSHHNKRHFLYENAWHLETGFKEMVTNSWQVYSNNAIMPKMSSCAEEMVMWSKEHCHKLKSKIEDCRRQLHTMHTTFSGEGQVRNFELRKITQRLLAQYDAYWRQRAKTHWYRDGDRNTNFFHASATAQKKVNRITSLVDDDGNNIIDEHGLRNVAREYFVNIFQKQGSAFDYVIDVISQSIFAPENERLTITFTKAEFHETLFSMHPDKCPGPNGINPGFYQHFWNLSNHDIFKERCAWLETGQFPPDMNMTNIALIPKGNSQLSMKY